MPHDDVYAVSYTHLKNRVNLEAFALAEKNSRHSLCYNGDIVDAASAAHIREGFPSVDKFMIGRGLIKRPWLLEELSGGRQEKQERKERFFRFHNAILEGYRQQMSGDKNTLFKMKELWAYWGENFADADQRLKKMCIRDRIWTVRWHFTMQIPMRIRSLRSQTASQTFRRFYS